MVAPRQLPDAQFVERCLVLDGRKDVSHPGPVLRRKIDPPRCSSASIAPVGAEAVKVAFHLDHWNGTSPCPAWNTRRFYFQCVRDLTSGHPLCVIERDLLERPSQFP